MKTEYIPKFVTLLAGAIVCIDCVLKNRDTTYSLEILLVTLVIFYILGIIAQRIIEKVKESNMVMKLKEMSEEVESEQTDENIDEEDDENETSENVDSSEI